MENIKLDNGKYLNRLYGKYQPNLTFISSEPLNDFEKVSFGEEEKRRYRKFFDGGILAPNCGI